MKIVTILLLAAFPISSFAANTLLFSCINNQGKKVEVREIGGNIQYSFGYPNNPELVFKNPKAQVVKQTEESVPYLPRIQWIVLKNGGYFYKPYYYFNSNALKNQEEAGVFVEKGESIISQIKCNIKTTHVNI